MSGREWRGNIGEKRKASEGKMGEKNNKKTWLREAESKKEAR